MNSFEVIHLITPTLFIFSVVFILTLYAIKSVVAAFIAATLKSTLYFVYYNIVFDGQFTFLDDWTYLDLGLKVCQADVGLLNLHQTLDDLINIAESNNYLYYLYNCYAFRIFSFGYFAPVALNVTLTAVIAVLGMFIAKKEFKLSSNSSKKFFIFLLFHPDILAWSNIMNGKDIAVLLFHVVILYGISIYIEKQYIKSIILIFLGYIILSSMRFYVPVMFFAALILAAIFMKKIKIKYIIGFVLFASGILFYFKSNMIDSAIGEVKAQFVNPIYGLLRFSLTPIPFHTDYSYEFLNLPATIHWLLFPFFIMGLKVVWNQKTVFSIYFLSYFIVFVLLYAVYDELQGPRHRVQLDFAIALLQFLGLRSAFKAKLADYLVFAATIKKH